MRSFFIFAILFSLFTACSSPQVTVTSAQLVTVTLPPTSTSLSTHTGTPLPSASPTATYTPTPEIVKFDAQTWAGTDVARTSFLEAGGQIDDENGVAWNTENGRVYFAKDAKGEWMSYPDGNVPIPPGPGFENEPPLLVPYYHSFTEAMTAITNELPWDELAETYREKQVKENEREVDLYIMPMYKAGSLGHQVDKRIDVHMTLDPIHRASVFLDDIQFPVGKNGILLSLSSEATDYYHKRTLIFGDPLEIYAELQRIGKCVIDNKKSSNLAELCASSLLTVASPNP